MSYVSISVCGSSKVVCFRSWARRRKSWPFSPLDGARCREIFLGAGGRRLWVSSILLDTLYNRCRRLLLLLSLLSSGRGSQFSAAVFGRVVVFTAKCRTWRTARGVSVGVRDAGELHCLVTKAKNMNKDVTNFLSLTKGSIAYVTHKTRLRTVRRSKLGLGSSLGNRRTLQVGTYATRRCGKGTSIVFMYIGKCSMSSVARLVGQTTRSQAVMVPVLGMCNAKPHVRHLMPKIAMLSKYVCVMNFISKPNRVARVKAVFHLMCNTRQKVLIPTKLVRTMRESLRRDNVGMRVSPSVGQSAFVG